jgi:hypothetical protein
LAVPIKGFTQSVSPAPTVGEKPKVQKVNANPNQNRNMFFRFSFSKKRWKP